MSFRHIYALLLCVIWVIYAYNVMFNLGTGMENVTHFKNGTILQSGTFKCGPASQPQSVGNCSVISPNSVM